MSQITLDAIKAAHDNVTSMLAKFEAQTVLTVLLPKTEIALAIGERYAGIAIGENGSPSHHLVLLADAADDITWPAAVEWAKSVGGDLPTRPEQALLYANLKDQFEAAWYWSCEQHAVNSDCAWVQVFSNGFQSNNHKSTTYRARAVRRLPI